MTSYHGRRDNLLVTSPTCRQLGIRHVNITQQLQQQAATTTHRSSARNNDDGGPSLTPVVSAADDDDDDDDDDASDTYDSGSLQYGLVQL